MDRLPSSECIKFCLKLLDLAQLTPFTLLPYAVSEPIGITIRRRSYASPRRKSYLEWEPATILLDSCCCAQIILYPVVDIVFLLIHALKEGLVLWSCTHGYYQIPTKSLISKRLSTLCRHTRRNYQITMLLWDYPKPNTSPHTRDLGVRVVFSSIVLLDWYTRSVCDWYQDQAHIYQSPGISCEFYLANTSLWHNMVTVWLLLHRLFKCY